MNQDSQLNQSQIKFNNIKRNSSFDFNEFQKKSHKYKSHRNAVSIFSGKVSDTNKVVATEDKMAQISYIDDEESPIIKDEDPSNTNFIDNLNRCKNTDYLLYKTRYEKNKRHRSSCSIQDISSTDAYGLNSTNDNLNQDLVIEKKIPSFIQPTMRFKPRTDFERIYEAIAKNNFGGVGKKKILNKNLMNLDPDIKKKEYINKLKNSFYTDEELNKELNLHNNNSDIKKRNTDFLKISKVKVDKQPS